MRKKGVEMSLNVIIIAAIGLLILLILAFLVVRNVSKVPASEQGCNVSGGLCQLAACANPANDLGQRDCPATTAPHCCKPIG